MKHISDKEIELSMERFEKDGEWFDEHQEELQKKYMGKVIAIKEQKIIGVNRKLDDLLNEIKSKGLDPANVYIASIPKESVAYIL